MEIKDLFRNIQVHEMFKMGSHKTYVYIWVLFYTAPDFRKSAFFSEDANHKVKLQNQ